MTFLAQFLPAHEIRQLLAENEVDSEFQRRRRIWQIVGAATTPLRMLENRAWKKRIEDVKLDPDPLYLLGYGRSGTTHLHNLIWQDPKFGGVTNYQATFHPMAIIGRSWLPKIISGVLPETRPMDNVAVNLNDPQEEEMALLNTTRHGALHSMLFSGQAEKLYNRYVCDLEIGTDTHASWKAAYLDVLKKASWLTGKSRLVLKTPPNIARIPVLLEMFPNAKFINIVRNPYRVYISMLNLYRKVLPDTTLQNIDWDTINDWTIKAYTQQMQRYLDTRHLIPEQNLIELRFEDLDTKPLASMERIYRELNLGEFDAVRSNIDQYLNTLGVFKKNVLNLSPEAISAVNANWGFAFKAFDYELDT